MNAEMIWAVVALLLAILEVLLPGLTLICLCFGALAAAIAAWLHGSILIQLAVFSAASIISFLLIRPLLLAFFSPSDADKQTNVQSLIGKTGKVVQAIPADGERGWVRVEHEEWPAVTNDRQMLAYGEQIVVKNVDGNTLIVEGVK